MFAQTANLKTNKTVLKIRPCYCFYVLLTFFTLFFKSLPQFLLFFSCVAHIFLNTARDTDRQTDRQKDRETGGQQWPVDFFILLSPRCLLPVL